MSFLARLGVVMKAHANDLLDKEIDRNSIPVVKEYIRELEDGLGVTEHNAALAAARITTLNDQRTALQHTIDQDTERAKAFKAQGDLTHAQTAASRVIDGRKQADLLDQQIAAAKTASEHMDDAVAQIKTKHDEMMNQLRSLELEDGNAKALEQSTKSLKAVQTIASSVDAPNVDNLAARIHEHNNAATEEFNRTVNGFKPAEPDPLKQNAVNDLLATL